MTLFRRKSPIMSRIPLTPTFHYTRRIIKQRDRDELLAPSKVKLFDDSSSDDEEDWKAKSVVDLNSSAYTISKAVHIRMALSWFLLLIFTCSTLILRNTAKRFQRLEKLPGGYRSRREMMERDLRFPCVAERVKVYMSSWYAPPCRTIGNINGTQHEDFANALIHYNFLHDSSGPLLLLRELVPKVDSKENSGRVFLVDSNAESKGSRIFFMDPSEIRKCDHSFCFDTKTFFFPSLKRLQDLDRSSSSQTMWKVPILLQFGDAEISRAFRLATKKNESYPNVPIIKKFRYSINRDELRRLTARSCYDISGQKPRDIPLLRRAEARLQPIVSKLTYKRHFGMLDEIPEFDIPWSQKTEMAVWRGALTGQKRDGFKLRDVQMLSPKAMCMEMHRCRLVLQTAESVLVNANLIGLPGKTDLIPETIDGIKLYAEKLSYSDMLQYKAIIMLEGNDVSSGLKWAMLSNSVVMTQPSTYTSWAMEELLEPWVHYIPLNEDLSDVEEKMQWVVDNDKEAEQIAHRGTLWISDLIYHPQAQRDDEAIFDETFLRYRVHFVSDGNLNP